MNKITKYVSFKKYNLKIGFDLTYFGFDVVATVCNYRLFIDFTDPLILPVTKTACENDIVSISCSDSMSIFIIDGFYGRQDANT